MKIAIITPYFSGATIPLAHHLNQRGHKVDYFLLARQGGVEVETFYFDEPVKGGHIKKQSKTNAIYKYLDKSVDIFEVPYYLVRNRKYLVGWLPWFRNVLIMRKLVKWIVDSNYDLVYIIVHEEWTELICKWLHKKKISNLVIAYHEILESHEEKNCLRKFVKDTVCLPYPKVVYSDKSKADLAQFIQRRDIHTIYFGPFETYKIFDIGKPIIDGDYLLFFGRILPYKGLNFLYEAIKSYTGPVPLKVVVAGDGKDPVVKDMKQDKHFVVLDRYVPNSELVNLITYSRGVICPYVSGSQSGITHTAMVFGIPVIATRVAAFPEFIEDGVNGILIDYGNLEQLTTAMERLISGEMKSIKIPCHLQWDKIISHFESLNKRDSHYEHREL